MASAVNQDYKIHSYCRDCGKHFSCKNTGCHAWKIREDNYKCVCPICFHNHACAKSITFINMTPPKRKGRLIGEWRPQY